MDLPGLGDEGGGVALGSGIGWVVVDGGGGVGSRGMVGVDGCGVDVLIVIAVVVAVVLDLSLGMCLGVRWWLWLMLLLLTDGSAACC